MSATDLEMMRLALEEARKGLGRTSPNPAVGAVIVKDGHVLASAHHKKAGCDHAEVAALRQLGMRCPQATMYVTLEPCAHVGRTTPCVDAIQRAGVKRVVVGTIDENPIVSGAGIKRLQASGIDVTIGVLQEECYSLNEAFFTYIRTGLPHVIAKAAISLDGKLGYSEQDYPITGGDAITHSHQLRNRTDAILVGVNTVLVDNPRLTTRYLPTSQTRDPLRIILDSSLRTPDDARCLAQQSQATTIVVTTESASAQREQELSKAGADVLRLPATSEGHVALRSLLSELGRREIVSLLVEGGSRVHAAFIREGLVDKLMLYIAPILLGENGSIPLLDPRFNPEGDALRLIEPRSIRLGEDLLVEGYLPKIAPAPDTDTSR